MASSTAPLPAASAVCVSRWPTAPSAYFCRVSQVTEILHETDPQVCTALALDFDARGDGSLGALQNPDESLVIVQKADNQVVNLHVSRTDIFSDSSTNVRGTLHFDVFSSLGAGFPHGGGIRSVKFRFGGSYPPVDLIPVRGRNVNGNASGTDGNNGGPQDRNSALRNGGVLEQRRREFFDQFGINLPRNVNEVNDFVQSVIRMENNSNFPSTGSTDNLQNSNTMGNNNLPATNNAPTNSVNDALSAVANILPATISSSSAVNEDEIAVEEPTSNQEYAAEAADSTETSVQNDVDMHGVGSTENTENGPVLTEEPTLPIPPEVSNTQAVTTADVGTGSTSPIAAFGLSPQNRAGFRLPNCIICMEAPADATFVHGNSGHTCCCYDCAIEVRGRGRGVCPICRTRVERVIHNFY